MLKTHHRFFRLLLQITDALIVALSWVVAYYVRFHFPSFTSNLNSEASLGIFLKPAEFQVPFNGYIPGMLGLMFVYFLCLQIFGAYKSWRTEHLHKELLAILKASFVGFASFVSIMHFVAREELSRGVLVLFFSLSLLFLCGSRLVLRMFLKHVRSRGTNLRHLLVIGDGAMADLLAKRISVRPELGFQISGFLQVGRPAQLLRSLPQSVDDLANLIEKMQPDQIIVSVRNEDAKILNQILELTSETNIHVRIVPDISQFAVLGVEVEDFDGLPVISINQSPLMGWNAVVKRMSDILYASVAILVFGPVMILVAILIKLTSRGPIFYSQERMGMDGRKFKMYKFRSMRTDAEVQSGAVWAQKGDARTTTIGKYLRKTSLDELPQFFNVLKGEMSCVGPRPERPVFVDQFKKKIPGYMLRHKVKAGITGWAQIKGFRGNTSLEGRIEHDLYYIMHWSLGLDLKIMFATLLKGFISPNAY